MSTSGRRQSTAQRRKAPGPGRGTVVLAMVAAGVVAGLVVALILARNDEPTGAPPVGAANDPGVSHVHGLGLNPADGSLQVATHYGTFRIPEEGSAQRIGDSYQDTMGFTVIGPDHFLGSGHPDVAGMEAGQPGLLGLIESTDGGETWQSVSLLGEVDFHALAAAHGRIYGWDSMSGRFMVSSDETTWDTRSTVDLYSFAVDPGDADQIVAAAPGGLRTSTDGGRTWSEPAGPELVVVSWDPAGTLWGSDQRGLVQESSDQGQTWEAVGELPGQPQALLAADGDLWAAAAGNFGPTGIYLSADGGRSWDLRYQDDPAG